MTDRANPCSIQVFDEGPDAARLALEGELDLAQCGELNEELRKLEARNLRLLTMDLSKLQFIDSSGLACFAHLVRRNREVPETSIRFIHGPEPVERLFEIVGLADILPFED